MMKVLRREEKVEGKTDHGNRGSTVGFENKISQLGCGISFSRGCSASWESRGKAGGVRHAREGLYSWVVILSWIRREVRQ